MLLPIKEKPGRLLRGIERNRRRSLTLVWLLLSLLSASFSHAVTIASSVASPIAPPVDAMRVVYLIRHAEKQSGDNPGLTALGRERAEQYKTLWQDHPIDYLFSTDYRRTKATLKPLADSLNLQLSFYDPRQLVIFAEYLQTLQGTMVVVGHSNTTPRLAEFLGADYQPMSESEYGRIYQLVWSKEGEFSAKVIAF